MKTIGLFVILSLFLSMNFTSGLKGQKDLIGKWVYCIRGKIGKPEFSIVWIKTKIEGNQYDGFEFRKKGELIVNFDEFGFCGNGPPVYRFITGQWNKETDTTVSIHYMVDDTIKITGTFLIYRRGENKLELKQIKTTTE